MLGVRLSREKHRWRGFYRSWGDTDMRGVLHREETVAKASPQGYSLVGDQAVALEQP